MKTKRLFGYEIKTHFSIEKFKTIEIYIPDWADDAHLRHGLHDGGVDQESWSATSDGEDKIVYYGGGLSSGHHEIPIPTCKRSVETFCTPLHDINKRRAGIKPDYSSNRKIVIDLYY